MIWITKPAFDAVIAQFARTIPDCLCDEGFPCVPFGVKQ